MFFIDLITENGQLFRVEVPRKLEDEIMQDIESCMKRRDWWSTSSWEGCTATFQGHIVNKINMGAVVALMQ